MSFDIDRMYKLPPEARFYDVNDLWYFPNRWVISFLYPLPITPTQITIVSLIAGLISFGCYTIDSNTGLILGALFLYLKIFLDNIDGNLARVRGEVSRLGRFLDSLTDFMINFLVYFVLTLRIVNETGVSWYWFLGSFALLSCLLHCSYFVFYLVNYTSTVGTYLCNRINESVSEEDNEAYKKGELSTLVYFLQRCHTFLYGWQDKSIEYFDCISRQLAFGKNSDKPTDADWYMDKKFLACVSPLCLCTNNMVLVLFSLIDQITWGFLLITLAGNAYLIGLQTKKILNVRKELRSQV